MTLKRVARVGLVVLGLAGLLTGCERPPATSVQQGYRGTGMVQIDNPRLVAARDAQQPVPAVAAPARLRPGGPTAGGTYQNIKVLGDLSLAEFGRTMAAMTEWVAPQESCAYCHVANDFADDSKYTKTVARRMLQMVRHLNQDWGAHVGATGVTCYTCHRGQPLPAERWFKGAATAARPGAGLAPRGSPPLLPRPNPATGSLPPEALVYFLTSEKPAMPVRVASTQALPGAGHSSIQQTEATYSLMVHMSTSLGVNCTFCHNTRAFASWAESSPRRVVAWQGLRMVRDVNANYLDPLSATFPEIPLGRLGPAKDAAKVYCATCHRGVNKPLNGAQMARHYPAMTGLALAAEAPASPASAAASAPGS